MITSVKYAFHLLSTPRLYAIRGTDQPAYAANQLERWSDGIVYTLCTAWRVGIYFSPLISGYLIFRGHINVDLAMSVFKIGSNVGLIFVAALLCRSFGRMLNEDYRRFDGVLQRATADLSQLNELQKYDFDFSAWPVGYSKSTFRNSSIFMQKWHRMHIKTPKNVARLLFGEFIVQLFAIKLIYPGSISLLQMALSPALSEGREKLYKIGGERGKLRTSDDSFVEVMFVDRRNKTQNGHTLVICTEGNGGYYEVGIMATPMAKGYSCLGWNHPGFGGSTGQPLPEEEQEFIDTVMQYSINKLGFSHENIILFGWSIGAYASVWAAANYPNVKALLLDATFDDLLPLAKSHMPDFLEPLVLEIVKNHVNLNISGLLSQYSGPVLLYRRTLDEIICTKQGDLSTNRGNDLLIQLLEHRYPDHVKAEQIDVLKQYLSLHGPAQNVFYANCPRPENKRVLHLATKYLVDFQSTHCTPLPSTLFQMPWTGELLS